MVSSYMPFQVKYMPQGPFCSTLLVELQPRALLVNVLGCSLVLLVEDSIVCRYLIKCFHNPLILHALFLVHRYFLVFYIICHSSQPHLFSFYAKYFCSGCSISNHYHVVLKFCLYSLMTRIEIHFS